MVGGLQEERIVAPVFNWFESKFVECPDVFGENAQGRTPFIFGTLPRMDSSVEAQLRWLMRQSRDDPLIAYSGGTFGLSPWNLKSFSFTRENDTNRRFGSSNDTFSTCPS